MNKIYYSSTWLGLYEVAKEGQQNIHGPAREDLLSQIAHVTLDNQWKDNLETLLREKKFRCVNIFNSHGENKIGFSNISCVFSR